MRKTLKIAKLELSILFYSPVAWLVLTIFIIQCGMSFLDTLQGLLTSLSLGYGGRPLTQSLFGGPAGLFTLVQNNLYLYLPILTMGLMSRETSSGTIKLLLSSPVKLTQIILGKYIAIITYGAILLLVLAFYAVIGVAAIQNADVGMILSGLLGLYLLICTYAAIGLFMSCLTTYQVVAAISTLAVFALLRFIGTAGQEIDFVRDLTYFLSLSGRTDKMINGLITTKDLFYYLIIIACFPLLCVLRLQGERASTPWMFKAGRYILLIGGALLLGYITSRPLLTGYYDATANKTLTITKTSQKVAGQIKDELKITTYANMLAPNLWSVLPASRNRDLSRLEPYQRFIPGMKTDYVYYYQEPVDTNYAEYRFNPNLKGVTGSEKIADKMATLMDVDRNLFLPPAKINRLVNLQPEGYLTVRKLDYKGKSAFIRFYTQDGDPYAGEAEVTAALQRLLVNAPKVVFLAGNNERSTEREGDRDYSMISALRVRRNALVNQGFDIDTVDLTNQIIPADADIVVIGDPTLAFTPQELEKIKAYINEGGNMLITGDPGRQNLLNPLLNPLGVQLKAGMLVKPDKNVTPGFINAEISPKATGIDPKMDRLQKAGSTVAMQAAAAIEYTAKTSFDIKPLLISGKDSWNKLEPVDLANTNVDFDSSLGDQKGAFPVVVALTRTVNNKQQRLLVSGDADFFSNAEFTRQKRGENEAYLFGLFRWLSNGVFPIDITRPPAKDLSMTIGRSGVTTLMWLCKAIIPAMIAILGTTILLRRRRN